MKKYIIILLLAATTASLTIQAQVVKKPKQKTTELPQKSKLTPQQIEAIKGASGVDLSAYDLKAVLISTSDKIHGKVKLIGTIKNISRNKYISASGQQEVVIMAGDKVVARKVFQNLNAGSIVQITYEMKWDRTDELNPDYWVQISFDPDLYTDGNTKNDDKVSSNNKKKLPAVQINGIVAVGVIGGS